MPSTSLSGGQQQMVAIGRALMSNPKLLLCDEISLGLAPIVVRDIYARLPAIVAEGISLVIVEQDIVQALKAASHVYCLQEGRVALTGSAGDADARGNLCRLFRGVMMHRGVTRTYRDGMGQHHHARRAARRALRHVRRRSRR